MPGWTTFDRYFSAVMAETYPNRFYLHCAQTDRLHNGDVPLGAGFKLPTIWDRLRAKHVSGKYYYSDIPFTFLLKSHAPTNARMGDPAAPVPGTFFGDAAAGTLPAVSYVDPQFLNEDGGLSNDDHPHADIRAGEVFMNQVYDAVRNGPGWKNTVLVITYDEWGGFFDHVPPGKAADVSPRTSLRGFRVPTVVISPFARRGHVSHQTFDHTSILKMIEWRWGLKPLTPARPARPQPRHRARLRPPRHQHARLHRRPLRALRVRGGRHRDLRLGVLRVAGPQAGRPRGRMGPSSMRARTTPLLGGLAVLLALGGLLALAPAEASRGALAGAPARAAVTRPPYVPPVGHVFVINIENKGYTETWGRDSVAPYLARTLRAKGVLLNHYYGTAHNSLPNYLAQISGQAPDLATQSDCQNFSAFTPTGPDQDGQAVGSGCVYPATVATLPAAADRCRASAGAATCRT